MATGRRQSDIPDKSNPRNRRSQTIRLTGPSASLEDIFEGSLRFNRQLGFSSARYAAVRKTGLTSAYIRAVPQCERILVHPHGLYVHSYKIPTFCDFCGEMLFGLVKQGLKCEGCGFNYHKRCASKIPNNCSGNRTRRPSVIPLSPRNSVSNTYLAGAGLMKSPSNHGVSPMTPSTDNVFGPPTPTDGSAGGVHFTINGSNSKDPSTRLAGAANAAATPDIFITGDEENLSSFLATPMPRKDRSLSWSGRPLWMEVEDAKRTKLPHTFQIHTYTKPTVCQYCKKLLKGLIRQGRQCRDCKYNCHKKCEEFVPKECVGNTLTQSPSFILGLDGGSESGLSSGLGTSGSISNLSQIGDGDDDDNSYPALPPDEDDLQSPNIPLQRIVQSKKQTKRIGKILKSGWLTHHTDSNGMKKKHYWRLDTKALTLFTDEETSRYYKEIPLSNILEISSPNPSTDSSNKSGATLSPPRGRNQAIVGICPGEDVCAENSTAADDVTTKQSTVACFLLKTANITYHVSVPSDHQKAGLEDVQQWYQAIRSALMPVTPQSSVGSQKMDRLGVPGLNEPGQLGVVLHSDQDFSLLYQICPEEILGSGQFGTVYGAVHRTSGSICAVKVIEKGKFPTKQEAALRTEVEILKTVTHSGIVGFQEMIETPERIYVVMERMKGDMLELILSSERGRLSERLTKFLIYQILSSLRYLHSQNIVHCDLKPENILLASDADFPQVKLCDFGFARIIGERSFRRSVVGTPAYLAPEVLRNKGFNRSLDMWSVGVIVYVSLSGTFPFNEDEDINDQIQNAAFMYPPNPWNEISDCAIDFISNLLQVKLNKRLTVHKALAHDWLQDYPLWTDLRRHEKNCGERYLTHESDDVRWTAYENKLGITRNY